MRRYKLLVIVAAFFCMAAMPVRCQNCVTQGNATTRIRQELYAQKLLVDSLEKVYVNYCNSVLGGLNALGKTEEQKKAELAKLIALVDRVDPIMRRIITTHNAATTLMFAAEQGLVDKSQGTVQINAYIVLLVQLSKDLVAALEEYGVIAPNAFVVPTTGGTP